MAGHTYVNRGYSNYTNAPPQELGYAYGPNQQVNWYMVETTTVERVHVPSSGYTNFGGGPSRNEIFKDYVPYPPRDHYEVYEVNYEPEYENSSPPRHLERENLMDKFLNKLQIEASRPTNFGKISGANKFRPKSPNKYRPKSPTHNNPSKEYFIRPQNLPDPNKYRPSSPTKYPPISPTKYRPTSPTKYRPTSPTKYRPSSPTKYRPSSPTKYRPTSPTHNNPSKEYFIRPQNLSVPNKHRPSSPTKYPPISPTKYRPSSPTKYRPTSPTKYRPSSPTKYRPSSPTNYRPTSPTKYRPTSPTKYGPTIPTLNYPSKEDHLNKAPNLVGPNKYRPTSPVHNFPSNGQPIGTQTLSGPNKQHPLAPRIEGSRPVRAVDFMGPNNYGQSTGMPATRPLTSPTNDINEALNVLAESANNSPRSDPESTQVFNKLAPRDTKLSFGGVARRFFISNTIDSREAARSISGCEGLLLLLCGLGSCSWAELDWAELDCIWAIGVFVFNEGPLHFWVK